MRRYQTVFLTTAVLIIVAALVWTFSGSPKVETRVEEPAESLPVELAASSGNLAQPVTSVQGADGDEERGLPVSIGPETSRLEDSGLKIRTSSPGSDETPVKQTAADNREGLASPTGNPGREPAPDMDWGEKGDSRAPDKPEEAVRTVPEVPQIGQSAPAPVVVPPPAPRRVEKTEKVPVVARPAPPAAQSVQRPAVQEIVLPPGTVLEVRLAEEIGTETHRTGDRFETVLEQEITAAGETILPKGARLLGRIVSAVEPGKVKGRANLTFQLDGILWNEEPVRIRTNDIMMEAEGTKGKDLKKIGAATAIGTALGAIFGGKKGAAIGGAAGAGASTAGVLLSEGEQVVLEKERLFSFRLAEEVVLTRY